MEFLVHITVEWPPDGDEDLKLQLINDERERALELIATRTIRRLWRIPGRWASVGLWESADASALHEAISSLPLFPWLRVDVVPLADHPADPGAIDDSGPST